MPSNDKERDFLDGISLIRNGKIDLNLFQNIDDVGDGKPGLQKAMRNWVKYWLHDGGMNQDVDMNDLEIQNLDIINNKIYFVLTDAEFDAAISDIEVNNYNGYIYILEDLTDVQATINDGSAGFTIDLCGHTLDANGDNDVITVSAAKHFTIKNGKLDISDFTSNDTIGIHINETSNNKCTIQNTEITGDGSHGYGIQLSSDNNTVTGNTCNSNNYGIFLDNSDNNTVTGNTCNSNDYGIRLNDSTDNTVTGNTCNSNDNSGIRVNDSEHNTVTGNTCNSNDNSGIYLVNSDNNTVTGNTCNSNNFGIYLDDSDNNTVTGNTCNSNDDYGIFLDNSDNNTVTGNTCNSNDYGIRLNDSTDNTVTGNTCNSNDNSGIRLTDSDDNLIGNNSCKGNGDENDATSRMGIYLDNADYNTIVGNYCSDWLNTGAGTGYGIYIDGDCDDTVIIGNHCRNNETNYDDNGVNTKDDAANMTAGADMNYFG